MAQFHSHQIVCLDHQNNHLFSEIIQLIPARQSFWVRPLFLIGDSEEIDPIDLRSLADLILPSDLFRAALDTEILPFLPLLEKEEYTLNNFPQNRKYLHDFIERVLHNRRENQAHDR